MIPPLTVLFCIALAITAASASSSSIVCNDANLGTRFPADSDTWYWICEWSGFAPTLMPCAPGTYFVERLQRCDASGGAGGGGGVGGGGGTGGTSEPLSEEDGSGGGGNGQENSEENAEDVTCPPCYPAAEPTTAPPQPESNEKEYCIDEGFICESYGGRMYAHPTDRTLYFVCPNEGVCANLMSCALGTEFFEERQICDWPRP